MTPGSISSTSDPIVLAIDAATPVPGLALAQGGRLLAALHLRGPLAHAQSLVPEIGALLTRLELGLVHLSGLAVTLGPGSFTGMRIGLATARGLALPRNLPILGISTLEALALKVPYAAYSVVPLVDPRRGQVYTASFDTSSGSPRRIAAERLVAIEALLLSVSAPTIFVGDGATSLGERLRSSLGERALVPAGAGAEGIAAVVATWAAERLQRGQLPTEGELLPRYLQASAAETNGRSSI